jgi:sulfite reductase alpha subunit-like flavoprotein
MAELKTGTALFATVLPVGSGTGIAPFASMLQR